MHGVSFVAAASHDMGVERSRCIDDPHDDAELLEQLSNGGQQSSYLAGEPAYIVAFMDASFCAIQP